MPIRLEILILLVIGIFYALYIYVKGAANFINYDMEKRSRRAMLQFVFKTWGIIFIIAMMPQHLLVQFIFAIPWWLIVIYVMTGFTRYWKWHGYSGRVLILGTTAVTVIFYIVGAVLRFVFL